MVIYHGDLYEWCLRLYGAVLAITVGRVVYKLITKVLSG